jgi:hypothetical protein
MIGEGGWRTVEFGPHSFGIERSTDRALVGSIDFDDGRWHVEILGHDIRASFDDHASALDFVRDVEATFARTSP